MEITCTSQLLTQYCWITNHPITHKLKTTIIYSQTHQPQAGCYVIELGWTKDSRLWVRFRSTPCFLSNLDEQLPGTCVWLHISHSGAQAEAAVANDVCCPPWGTPKCKKESLITQGYKASACIMCTNIILANTTYTIKSKVREWGIILCHNEFMAVNLSYTISLLGVIAKLK